MIATVLFVLAYVVGVFFVECDNRAALSAGKPRADRFTQWCGAIGAYIDVRTGERVVSP